MSEELVPEEPEEEIEQVELELENAFENLTHAIEDVLSILGEDNTSLLTDWVVVGVSQSIGDDGRHMSSPAIVLPRSDEMPIHRIKGLLVDALDGLRNDETTTVIVVNADIQEDGDDDDGDASGVGG